MFLGWNLKMSCNWNWSDQVWWFWLETGFGVVGSSEVGAGSWGERDRSFYPNTHQPGPGGWGSHGKWHHPAEWVEAQRPGIAVLPCQWFEQCCCWRNRWRRKGILWGLVLAVSHLEIRKAGEGDMPVLGLASLNPSTSDTIFRGSRETQENEGEKSMLDLSCLVAFCEAEWPSHSRGWGDHNAVTTRAGFCVHFPPSTAPKNKCSFVYNDRMMSSAPGHSQD